MKLLDDVGADPRASRLLTVRDPTARKTQGWPKLLFAVYERDALAMVDSFVGYGVAALPLAPGTHDVSASVFVANDRNARLAQGARDYFTAARPELEGWKTQMLHREEMHAAPVVTKGMGEIHVNVSVLCKNLHISGTHVKPTPRGELHRRAGGRSPRGDRSPRGRRSPSPVEGEERASTQKTRGLDSVRRRFADAAQSLASPAQSESDASAAEGSAFVSRRARRAAGAFGAAAALGRAGSRAPGGDAALSAPGGRRARHARAAVASPPPAPAAQPAATFAHQREAIEDAPLASGRDARRALREARMSEGGSRGSANDANPNPGGRRSRNA